MAVEMITAVLQTIELLVMACLKVTALVMLNRNIVLW